MSGPLSTYAVLPLRDMVVFPHMIVPLFVGRDKSVRALETVMRDDRQILLVAQIDHAAEDPGTGDMFRTGVLANVLQLLKLPDGTVKVLVEGKTRVRITEFTDNDQHFEAEAIELEETPGEPEVIEALTRAVLDDFERYAKIKRNVPRAIVHVQASFNNTIISVTDPNGEVLCWDSAGTIGYKGSRKSTPFAAQKAAERVADKALKMGVREAEVKVKGPGAGRESAIRSLAANGIKIRVIEDRTPIPHNGCRPRKRRRV